MITDWRPFWAGFYPVKGHKAWKCFIHPYTIISREDVEREGKVCHQECDFAFVNSVDGGRMVYMAE
jgi:hypothetical protein